MPQEFEFTDDLLELRSMMRDFCDATSPEPVVRETMLSDSGFDPALWRRLGSEIGVLGLAVPEEYGGGGAGLVYQAIVLEELGASLFCGPVLGLCLAVPALTALSDEEIKTGYLPEILAGERIATLAAPIRNGVFDSDAVTVSAERAQDGWVLDGTAAFVPDGASADLILVAATVADQVALFAVEADAAGLTRTALSTMDLTRRQADLALKNCPARQIADPAEAPGVIERATLVGATLLAAEQVGVARQMLDTTVAHVSGRLQFGQPIGAFQAVKHRCANMLIAVEQARSAAYHAAWALDDASDHPRLAVSLARAVASESSTWISTSAIQMHGGLGFTWEGTPHLYFKRATTDALVLGTPEQHVDEVARAVLDPLAGAA
ncbi:acyl-CoA dehydrogenase family protein [Nocardia miyunensis]|uniref:acyl-CoA dehydrogenase family protein n=1 Tax=Nocardia miyunensis TaxID=282684 RepID=UPI0008370D3E|nr:acyl-CoA dehydrogenase family protein [Nocardia miyunensis]